MARRSLLRRLEVLLAAVLVGLLIAAAVDAWYRGLATRYPHGTVEIVPDTGHLIHIERPSLVIERVRTIVLAARQGP